MAAAADAVDGVRREHPRRRPRAGPSRRAPPPPGRGYSGWREEPYPCQPSLTATRMRGRCVRSSRTSTEAQPPWSRTSPRRGIQRALEELHSEHAARRERHGRELEQPPEDVEPVRPAIKREAGLEVAHLGGDLLDQHARGDVGRVGDENREAPQELWIHARGEVALHDVHRLLKPQRLAVSPRKGNGTRREVGGRDERARALGGDRERDAARPGAHLEHADGLARLGVSRARHGVNALERRLNQQLRLGPRDEDPALAAQDDVAEGHLPGHVLQRLAGRTPLDRGVHLRELRGLERTVKVDVELHAREPRDGGEQPLRGETRMLVPLALEVAARPVEDTFDGPGVLRHHGPSRPPPVVTAS